MKFQSSFILPPRGIPAAEVRQFWQSCVEETRVFARVSPIHKQAPLRSVSNPGVRVTCSKNRKIGKFCKFLGGLVRGCIKTKFCKKINSKSAFDIIFRDLQDVHTSAPLQSQNFSKKSTIVKLDQS